GSLIESPISNTLSERRGLRVESSRRFLEGKDVLPHVSLAVDRVGVERERPSLASPWPRGPAGPVAVNA
ncbi:hypothetical protein, partial [Frankia sp. Cj5]|uniref:hypothetical protein n=1 Tax=Frankia sp. Cj5 TaxID=2880978 RepID=UPI001EF5A40A